MSKVVHDQVSTIATNHPARTTDFAAKSRGQEGYVRFIAVDVPEHDLDVIVEGIVLDPNPDPTNRMARRRRG